MIASKSRVGNRQAYPDRLLINDSCDRTRLFPIPSFGFRCTELNKFIGEIGCHDDDEQDDPQAEQAGETAEQVFVHDASPSNILVEWIC